MLAQVGHPHDAALVADATSSSRSSRRPTASFVEFGWTPDDRRLGHRSTRSLRTWDKAGLGTFNAGRYSNPKLDALIDAMRVEPDLTRRRAMVATCSRFAADELPLVPLYRRTLTWAMQRKVQLVQWPNDSLELRWLRSQ